MAYRYRFPWSPYFETVGNSGRATPACRALAVPSHLGGSSLPLELKVPNTATRAAMAEAVAIMKSDKVRFANAEEAFAELERPHLKV